MSESDLSRRGVLAAACGLAAASASAAEAATAPRVCLLGDSITAGYGLPASQALPARLQGELARLGHAVRIAPAGVNGSTTAGALARVDRAAAGAKVCVVALGGNDLLTGAEPAQVKRNLDGIVRRLQARGIRVVLAGLRVPPILNGAWATAFNDAFTSVAREHRLVFVPDMLGGVALNPRLNQPDGIHPNAQGVELIARRMAPFVARALAAG